MNPADPVHTAAARLLRSLSLGGHYSGQPIGAQFNVYLKRDELEPLFQDLETALGVTPAIEHREKAA